MSQNDKKYYKSMCLKIGEKDCLSVFSGKKTELLKRLLELMDKDTGLVWVATVNPEFVIEAKKDKKFANILERTTINTADGIGIVWANMVGKSSIFPDGLCHRDFALLRNFQFLKIGIFGRLLAGLFIGTKVLFGKYRHMVASGSELMVDLSKESVKREWKVFFLGGFGDAAMLAAENINGVVGGGLDYEISQGKPDFSDAQVLLSIYKFRPKIVFVAYGMKKQEEWIYKHRLELKKAGVRLVMGVGRSFDYYSGKLKMAPSWVRRMGLEWLFALINDPKRWKRDLKLIEFVRDVIRGIDRERDKGGDSSRAVRTNRLVHKI